MVTATPNPADYQQLSAAGGATGNVDCTCWSDAMLCHAHSKGLILVTGRQIRLNSDEAKPDPYSPGLNLQQGDDSLNRITHSKVDLDTHVQARALNRAEVQWRIVDGRWASIQLIRATLVDRGFGGSSRFRGPHCLTVHARADGVPIIFDPLVPYGIAASWDAIFDAAEALTHSFAPGQIYCSFTRDLTPDYHFVLKPSAGTTIRKFAHWTVNAAGLIDGSGYSYTRGMNVPCTPPRLYRGDGNHKDRILVSLNIPGRHRNGWLVNANYASEIIP